MSTKTRTAGGAVLLALIGIALIAFACDDDSTAPTTQGPNIPPLTTFAIDFSAFPDTAGAAAKLADVQSFDNWGWSRVNVFVWNVVITVHAVVPVAAYVEAFNHIPQQQEDGSWVWTYDVIVGNDTVTAELHAGTNAEGLDWEMYLSKSGEFTNFLWYAGQHDLLYTQGTWTLYKNPADPVQFVAIEWHRNLVDSTADIKYTNIEPGSAGNGGYITYGTTTDLTYDAFYDIFIAEQEHYIDIEWNLDTHIGRVLDSTHFEDAAWHCWDEHLEDVACD